MNRFSRKIVLFLIVIIAQSSLGTNAALKDFSNVTTKNLGQNGYYKLPDGLMIQWGCKTQSYAGNVTVYFPISFADSNYSLVTTLCSESSTDAALYVAPPYYTGASSFSVRRRYYNVSSMADSAMPIFWIAIGRWK